MATPKRKKKLLTVEEKLKEIQRGVSYTLISEKYGIGRLTVAEVDINEWLESDQNDRGYEHLDDAGIVEHVLRQSSEANQDHIESDSEEQERVRCITHNKAIEMFDECITWLHCQPEATPYNTSVLLSLREIATKKRFSSLRQTTMTSFFE